MSIQIGIKNISGNKNPRYEHKGDAGVDVRADFSRVTPENPIRLYGDGQFCFESEVNPIPCLVLESGSRALIPTGIFLNIPDGYEIQIRPRSGLALKEGVMCALGTVDAIFRGEIGINLFNLSNRAVVIEHGERVAQLVLKKVEEIEWIEVDDVGTSERNTNGFGSTGLK